jgi:hypothetical protein
MSFCQECGTDFGTGTFCTNCGKAMVQSQEPAEPIESVTVLPTSVAKPSASSKKVLIPVGIGAAVVAAGAIIFSLSMPSPLENAYQACGGDFLSGITISEDGKSMLLDMQGEEDLFGADYSEIACVLRELEVPDIVDSQISITTSLMGVQTADWDGITANWTYHPDRGLDISLEMN